MQGNPSGQFPTAEGAAHLSDAGRRRATFANSHEFVACCGLTKAAADDMPWGYRARFVLGSGKVTTMSWETPSFIEIDMSAEIGSYEGEDYDGL